MAVLVIPPQGSLFKMAAVGFCFAVYGLSDAWPGAGHVLWQIKVIGLGIV